MLRTGLTRTVTESKLENALCEKLMNAKIWLYKIDVEEKSDHDIHITVWAEQDIGVQLSEEKHFQIIERIVRPVLDQQFNKYKFLIRSTGHPL